MRRAIEPRVRVSLVSPAPGASVMLFDDLFSLGIDQPIAESPFRQDAVRTDLAAQTADKHLDGVRIAVEVLVVDVLDQLRPRHHAPLMVHQVAEHPVFVRGQLDWLAVYRSTRRTRV